MIYNGDCLDIMPTLADKSIDLTVTSPPYDNLRTYNGNIKLWGEHVWKAAIKDLYRVTKDGGVVVWIVADATINGSETGTSFKQALWAMECGFNLHDTMIYEKSGFSNPSTNRCHQVFEYMFVLSKGNPKTFNKIFDRKNKYSAGGGASCRKKDGEIVKTGRAKKRNQYGQRYNIWRYATGGGHMNTDGYKHPAQFPEQLATDHILSWSNEGDTVLDPFAGSGTTGVACLNTGRKFILIEKDAGYCEIIKKRIESHQPLLQAVNQ